jgi:hypothetical protein
MVIARSFVILAAFHRFQTTTLVRGAIGTKSIKLPDYYRALREIPNHASMAKIDAIGLVELAVLF